MWWRRPAPFALALALALPAAGCGGDEGVEGAEAWADDVCTSLDGWVDEIDGTVRELTEKGLAVQLDDLRDAVDTAADATDGLVADLEALEAPETAGAAEARQVLDDLGGGLRDDVDTVQGAMDEATAPLDVAATVAGTVGGTLSQLDESLARLRDADVVGDVADGFTDAEDCTTLGERVDALRP